MWKDINVAISIAQDIQNRVFHFSFVEFSFDFHNDMFTKVRTTDYVILKWAVFFFEILEIVEYFVYQVIRTDSRFMTDDV